MGDKSIKAYMSNETVFKGTLNFVGTVRIDGKFEGNVETTDTLIVGEMGEVKADIEVGSLICMGKVIGTIRAKDKIQLMANSHISGNIITPSLTIEQGAILDGNCNMSGQGTNDVAVDKTEDAADNSGEETQNSDGEETSA